MFYEGCTIGTDCLLVDVLGSQMVSSVACVIGSASCVTRLSIAAFRSPILMSSARLAVELQHCLDWISAEMGLSQAGDVAKCTRLRDVNLVVDALWMSTADVSKQMSLNRRFLVRDFGVLVLCAETRSLVKPSVCSLKQVKR
jgi:hypothetical protein